MTAPLVSVIVPVRRHESVNETMTSLMAQTCQDFEVIVRVDPGRGQAWARNRAAETARGEYLWFSDADLRWTPTALQAHLDTLQTSVVAGWKTGYAYGGYHLMSDGKILETLCDRAWSWDVLQQRNIISTMALMRRDLFLEFLFDETFHRLEDWELWVRMARAGYAGVFCNKIGFSTELRPGVTFSGAYDHAMYETALRRKHGI